MKKEKLMKNVWDENAETLVFVNPEDFQKDMLLGRIGLKGESLVGSFGATDREEIRSRQELIRLIWEDESLAKELSNGYIDGAHLPITNPREFLEYYRERRPAFYRSIDKYAKVFRKHEKSMDKDLRLWQMLQFIARTKDDMLKKELTIRDSMIDDLDGYVEYQGLIDFDCSFTDSSYSDTKYMVEKRKVVGLGWQNYGYHLSKYFFIFKMPKKKFWKVVAWIFMILALPVTIGMLLWNARQERRKYSPLVQKELDPNIVAQVEEYIKSVFEGFWTEVNRDYYDGKKAKASKFSMKVFVQYKDETLRVKLVDVVIKGKRKDVKGLFDAEFFSYDGMFSSYSRRFAAKFWSLNQGIKNSMREKIYTRDLQEKFFDFLKRKHPEFARYDAKGEEVSMDYYRKNRFKKDVIASIFKLKAHLNDEYEEAVSYRNRIVSFTQNIEKVAKMVKKAKKAYEELGVPYCWPEVLDDSQHLIEFEMLQPVHLIGRTGNKENVLTAEDLIPINRVAPLNGKMVTITGNNGRGKTSMEEELVDQLYLGHSGLPVHAKSFRFNAKRVIGLLFIQRGGSMIELGLKKAKKIQEAIEGLKLNHILLIIDELMTGTQEAEGFAYGKRILYRFNEQKLSIIFATQNLRLAEYAVEKLEAIPVAVDEQYQFSPGIRGGNPGIIFSELGMDEMFPEVQ